MADAVAAARWRWYWKSLCGDEELVVWSPQRHDFGLCFQQLCIEIPVLSILACVSAYYFGKHADFVQRGGIQMTAINIRCIIVLLLAFLPVLQIYIDINERDEPIGATITYFLSAVQGIAWFTHFLYLRGLRKRLGKSARGPILICVIWCLLFVMAVISLRSHYLIYKYDVLKSFSIYLAYVFSICYVVIQVGYAITLIPNEGNTSFINYSNRFRESEHQPLLHNAYVRFVEEGDPAYLGVAMEGASWLSRLLFYWVNPLMDKGVQGKLSEADDLYDLPVSLNCAALGSKLDKALVSGVDVPENEQSRNSFPSFRIVRMKATLLIALHRCFWIQFYGIGVLKLIADITAFAGPMLLNKLVGFIENKSEDIKWGYLYATGLMLATLISSLCGTHFDFLMSLIGFKIRAALVTTIYKKTISVSSTTLNSRFSVGEIINFMSTDTDRIVNSCPSFHALWSIPFQLAVTLYLLYSQVGLAFLAGLVFAVVLIPINKLIADKIGKLSARLMEQKDSRVRVITEVLRGIRAVKLYVWEQHFIRQITRVRDKELKYLKGRKYLDALCVYFWATTPVIISILTFATYVLMGNKLTAATVFTSIALLNMLISPLNAFPWVLNGMAEAWVSIKRIQKFLNLPDLDLDKYYCEDLLNEDENSDIIIKNATFNWAKELTTEEKVMLHSFNTRKSKKGKGKGKRSSALSRLNVDDRILEEDERVMFKLEEINFKMKKGEFVGVMGSVGCGKSSILAAILAELLMDSGEIMTSQCETGFGLVTQVPWLQRGTVRDNILFGKPFDNSKYNEVIFACGLTEDINRFPAGDMTGVGEGGATLSGGQKARVALARAVYQEKTVYLLDDILSAVDVNVAKHIFHHCIMGLLKNKTRILCTHHVQYLAYADRIILMENGKIKDEGKPAEVLSNIDDTLPIDIELGESIQSVSHSLSTLLDSCVHSEDTTNQEDKDSLLDGEISQTGSLSLGVYGSYWKATGHLLSVAIILSVALMQSSRNVTDWWLAQWVTSAENNSTNNATRLSLDHEVLMGANTLEEYDTDAYLKIYVELAVLNTLFTLFRSFLFAYGAIIAAAKLHKLLLKSVMKGKSTFFDVTPTGRILNRFSSDTYTIDDSLPFIMNVLLAQISGLIGILVITIYGLPWICTILVPLIPVYHWLQNHYRLTSRELKRISSVTLSPVYNHFNETLQGLVSIRALRASQRFKHSNQDYVEANLKAQFSSQAATRWLGLRLQFIGVAIISGIGFIVVVQHQFDVADPGLVGLAISYALSVTGALGGVVNAFTETEREMIAVERVNQYINEIQPESSHFVCDPPFGWPSQGVISFSNVVLKYRENLVPALKGVTFETRPLEKIGVVGRTGAGKSSIVSAIFRLIEITSGSICIDSVDIRRISIATLRSRLFCIPQDPFLFSGTVRDNLDPLGEFRDYEIWNALNKVNLGATIRNFGGLANKVETNGNNFSVGQKQLICLARAVLHNAKVLCIDEATASVDMETDRQIQKTLRFAFRKSTVITIAHRVQTILDSDRVIVMDGGSVVEFGCPDDLLADTQSYFYQLVNQE